MTVSRTSEASRDQVRARDARAVAGRRAARGRGAPSPDPGAAGAWPGHGPATRARSAARPDGGRSASAGPGRPRSPSGRARAQTRRTTPVRPAREPSVPTELSIIETCFRILVSSYGTFRMSPRQSQAAPTEDTERAVRVDRQRLVRAARRRPSGDPPVASRGRRAAPGVGDSRLGPVSQERRHGGRRRGLGDLLRLPRLRLRAGGPARQRRLRRAARGRVLRTGAATTPSR